MSTYLQEFAALALIHLLAVMSPGPDFAVIVRQSIRYGRHTATLTALGLGAGIALHVSYCLVGIAALMRTTPWVLQGARMAGALYLLYLGVQFLRSQPAQTPPDGKPDMKERPMPHGKRADRATDPACMTTLQALRTGLMTNATNPKATLFFLAVFSTVISASTPLVVQAMYGLWMVVATAAWFAFVAAALTHSHVRTRLLAHGHWLERGMGALLLLFAAKLLLGD